MSVITLKDEDVFSLYVSPDEQTTKGENPRPYWRGRYGTRGFTINDGKFVEDFEAGEVAQVTLEESSYLTENDDPANPGQKLRRDSAVLSGYATWKQIMNTSKNLIRKDLLRVQAMKEMNLNDADMASLQVALKG